MGMDVDMVRPHPAMCSTLCVFGNGKAHRRFEHVGLAANKTLCKDMRLPCPLFTLKIVNRCEEEKS